MDSLHTVASGSTTVSTTLLLVLSYLPKPPCCYLASEANHEAPITGNTVDVMPSRSSNIKPLTISHSQVIHCHHSQASLFTTRKWYISPLASVTFHHSQVAHFATCYSQGTPVQVDFKIEVHTVHINCHWKNCTNLLRITKSTQSGCFWWLSLNFEVREGFNQH